jgi:hypothetical protein
MALVGSRMDASLENEKQPTGPGGPPAGEHV